jgi:hypothetical protein
MGDSTHSTSPQNDGGYWSPIRPWLRWPTRIVGLLFLAVGVGTGFGEGDWRMTDILKGLAFLLVSFSAPERRFDGIKRTPALVALILFFAIIAFIFFRVVTR